MLATGVEEGRRTYANVMKYIRMGTSSSFGNMLSMALASLAIPFLPLTPIQVLLNNLLYEMGETGIPFDRVDEADIAKPHRWEMRRVLRFTMIMGPLSSFFDIATFAALLWVFHATPELFRTAWFVESISTQILVIFLIRTAAPCWRSRAHPILVATSLGALAVAWMISLTTLGHVFGFTMLPLSLITFIGLLTVAYLALAEIAKRFAISPHPSSPKI